MTELMKRVRAAESDGEAIQILVAAGYVLWEAEITARMERGTGGLYDVKSDGQLVIPESPDDAVA